MPTKDQTAQALTDAHFHLDAGISRVFRVLGPDEADERAPVKLLEVNPMTVEVGISPIGFAAAPARDVHHGVIVIEISDREYDKLLRHELDLPHGWTIGHELFTHGVEVGQ